MNTLTTKNRGFSNTVIFNEIIYFLPRIGNTFIHTYDLNTNLENETFISLPSNLTLVQGTLFTSNYYDAFFINTVTNNYEKIKYRSKIYKCMINASTQCVDTHHFSKYTSTP